MSRPAILYVHDLRGSGVVTNAIALAAEETPCDPGLTDRLLRLTLRGLKSL